MFPFWEQNGNIFAPSDFATDRSTYVVSWKLKIGEIEAETHANRKKQTPGEGFSIFIIFQLEFELGTTQPAQIERKSMISTGDRGSRLCSVFSDVKIDHESCPGIPATQYVVVGCPRGFWSRFSSKILQIGNIMGTE